VYCSALETEAGGSSEIRQQFLMSKHLTYQAMNQLRIYAFMKTLSGILKIMRELGSNCSAVKFT
jgi:hypothetical protein